MEQAVWTIPPERMKSERAHRVPLSAPALAILTELAKLRDDSGLIFHGQRHGRPMSDMTLTAVLRRMGRGDLTGFAAPSVIGRRRKRRTRTTSWNSRWRTRSATRSRRLTGAVWRGP